MKPLFIFKNIDKHVFQALDKLRSRSEYAQVESAFAGLDDEIKEVLKQILLLMTVIVPVCILMLVNSSNNALRKELDKKEDIIRFAADIISNTGEVINAKTKVLGARPINNQNTMTQVITQTISAAGIDTSKIQNGAYDNQILDGNIARSSMSLKFSRFSSEDIFSLMTALATQNKFRIDTFSVRKGQSDNLLNGQMDVIYYSEDKLEDL